MTLLRRRHLENVGSSKDKRIWVTRENETKARRNIRKRHSLVRRINEKRKKKRRINRCPALSGDLKLEGADRYYANGVVTMSMLRE